MHRKKTFVLMIIIVIAGIAALYGGVTSLIKRDDQAAIEPSEGDTTTMNQEFVPTRAIGKLPPNGNPLISHRFGADPYALVFEDRVYLYATNDVLEYDADGEVKDNSYGHINKLSVISSSDLMNWTDHGVIHVAGPEGAAQWASQSWAPAIAHQVIDGKDQFFIYFANNASHIGVLTSDSPLGPWVDPLGKPLITRQTPGVEGVTWLFDPAVLVDDDGQAYLYFGGGIPDGEYEMPNTARVMPLGDDMISVVGEATVLPAPFMFESSGINKVGDTYYYTYSSNFYSGERPEGSPSAGEIAYMTSQHPLGPWTYQGSILKNPGHFFQVGGNNHQAIFSFRDQYYIAYHAQTLSKAMGIPKGYRSLHLNKVEFNEDGTIHEIIADLQGVQQLQPLNPYERVEAETMAWSAGVMVEPKPDDQDPSSSPMILTDIDNGDWTAIAQVDFGEGAASFTARVASGNEGGGSIELRLNHPNGQLFGTLEIPYTGGWDQWVDLTTDVNPIEGVDDLYLVFRGNPDETLFYIDYWQFSL